MVAILFLSMISIWAYKAWIESQGKVSGKGIISETGVLEATPSKIPPPPPYPPDAPLLQRARKALRDGIDPAEAVILATSLPEGAERADAAFLLLEYAADMGNAEAALAVARYYDPTDNGPNGTIRKNPSTAFEWYQKARAGGQESAKNLLPKLRRWLEKEAEQGSREAQDLLSRWDRSKSEEG